MKKGERKLTGAKRWAFQAQVPLDHLDGNVRQAESVFGWSRKTVELGLNELRTGITCIGNFGLRGRPRVEDEHPQLVEDMLAHEAIYVTPHNMRRNSKVTSLRLCAHSCIARYC
jgi:hypothetical protein